MERLVPAAFDVNADQGTMTGCTRLYEKRLRDLDDVFSDRRAWRRRLAACGNETVYEVCEFRGGGGVGDLIFGTCTVHPGRVGLEFYMTRGHLHLPPDRAEALHGQRGAGVVMMESLAGEVSAVELHPHEVVYVPPFCIHRLVNVGSENLVTLFFQSADTCHDYDAVTRTRGFRSLITGADGAPGWEQTPNDSYQPRARAEIEAIRDGISETEEEE